METEKASLEDLIKAKEEERSLAEVERVLADFMPEDDQTVSEWYDERIQEIEEGFNNGEIDTVAHQAFKKDLLRARILLLEQFK
ncbi:hypothetical protein EOM60_04640 [Candidatus Saccharibacteria bacterium]|nr:hypothetical protein [Candidatus Saccharibacteria bacterium]